MRFSWISLAAAASLGATSTSTKANAQADGIDERAILLELYNAAGGNAWQNNLGWAENSNEICDWHGVICNEDDLDMTARRDRKLDSSDAKVLGLELRSNYLTGRTPSSIWKLPALIFADFSYNPHLDVSFSGLAQEETKLRSIKLSDTATTSVVGIAAASDTLDTLQLSENNFNAQIPTDIYSLTQLTSLHMAECGLLGSLPNDIHRLSMLRELNFFHNSLTGTLPEGLQRLIHLRHLSLTRNQLHGSIPEYINDWVLLNQLWLANNDFTGSIPSLYNSPEIHKVYLNGNSLGGEFPENFLQATLIGPRANTIHVNLAHNELEGVVPESLDALSELEVEFILGDNKWTGISDALCDNTNWNNGAVADFECMGLLCPPNTYAFRGYQTAEATCQPCASNEYWGATTCFDKDDRSVLVELFVALKGENWKRNDNWVHEDDFCTWYGITCWGANDEKSGRVRKIQLSNNGLEGVVPENLWSSEHLTTLELSYNDIVLPFNGIGQSEHIFSVNVAATRTTDFDGIADAPVSFRELHADQVSISGTIPAEVFGLAYLEVLSMQECGLVGEIPDDIFGMTSLRELYLTNNKLNGVLKDRWDEMNHLELLALANNLFRGSVPTSFDLAPSLRAVSLEDQITKGGGLTGAIHSFTSTSTMRTLRLAKNKLDGELPSDLLYGLEGDAPVIIDLSDNMLSGSVHGAWDRFKRLELYLQGNLITEIEERLCQQDDWMSGSVKAFGCDAILCPAGTSGGRHAYNDSPCRQCKSSTSPGYLGQTTCGDTDLEELTERDILELLYDQCGGHGWHSREYWKTELRICEWYGIDCNENGSVTSIQLGGNQLVGSFPTEIYRLPNLRNLKLYSNTIYFNFDGIDNAKNLQSLGLDGTGLESLKGIGKARSLVELNVAYNNLSGPVPEEIGRLVNLGTFDISHNSMDGFLPYWLRSLVSLKFFSVSHNKISGPVYDFSTFQDLVYIDLSHNQLTGSVPSTLFHKSRKDEKLIADLSSNQLDGVLPGDLLQFSDISLQVAGNRITGIDEELCEAENWNDHEVKAFGCDAILCPKGTWNHLGRMSNEETPCQPCRKANYMGTNHCHSGASLRTLGLWTVGVVSWMLLV